jgi:hypothetical protein
VLNRFGLDTLSIYGQLQNKITFYPIIEGAYVNTKNWYREETDMWAEFDRVAPFGRRFSSKRSVEASTVRSTPSKNIEHKRISCCLLPTQLSN